METANSNNANALSDSAHNNKDAFCHKCTAWQRVE
jgi:hypothetical protein